MTQLLHKVYHISILSLCQSFIHFTKYPFSQRFLMLKSATTALASVSSVPLSLNSDKERSICLGLTGDIMIGRGIDAILPHHVDGTLYESYMQHAYGYVNLAIQQNGPLSQDELKKKGSNYIWGDLLETLKSLPDAMVVNLETSLTICNDYAKGKGINYRAHPLNVQSLKALGSSCVITLANNHVLDWGQRGLVETLETLRGANIQYTGAGHTIDEAMKPVVSTVNGMKVGVVAVGFPTAGVPMQWKADKYNCGVYVEEEASPSVAKTIMKRFLQSTDKDIVRIVSVHMGPNWNWNIPKSWREFAHTLIDNGADLVVAHSSHHVKGIEVYKKKMICYGLGDFLNDYEGITGQGYEIYRQDLASFYLPRIKISGELLSIDIIPCQIKNLKVQRATKQADIDWLKDAFSRQGKELGTSCEKVKDHLGNTNLRITWK